VNRQNTTQEFCTNTNRLAATTAAVILDYRVCQSSSTCFAVTNGHYRNDVFRLLPLARGLGILNSTLYIIVTHLGRFVVVFWRRKKTKLFVIAYRRRDSNNNNNLIDDNRRRTRFRISRNNRVMIIVIALCKNTIRMLCTTGTELK